MNTRFSVIRFLPWFVLLLAFIAFSGCGLDNFVYLVPVRTVSNDPTTVEQDIDKYFEFRTTDAENDALGAGYFLGFEVWYRIYNDSNYASQEAQAIMSQNTTNPSGAVNYLKTRGFQRMASSSRPAETPLIPGAASDRTIKIRLIKFDDLDTAQISIDSVPAGTPLRTLENGITTKDFAHTEIENGDTDLYFNGDLSTEDRFVQAFVFALGRDESYKLLYSSLCDLGRIKITP